MKKPPAFSLVIASHNFFLFVSLGVQSDRLQSAHMIVLGQEAGA